MVFQLTQKLTIERNVKILHFQTEENEAEKTPSPDNRPARPVRGRGRGRGRAGRPGAARGGHTTTTTEDGVKTQGPKYVSLLTFTLT